MIPDHLDTGLSILFIGFNPSITSGETGHHYAYKGNRFWRILERSGLTHVYMMQQRMVSCLKLGYGFTNIVARPTKGIEDISKEEYAEGREILRKKLETFRPDIACFVGKGVYTQYSKRSKVEWGFQDDPVVKEIQEFVAPSSSGLVRMSMDEIVAIYARLADFVAWKNGAE